MLGSRRMIQPEVMPLLLKVLQGSPVEKPYDQIPMYLLHVYKHPERIEILTGLIEQGLVGKEFLKWVMFKHCGNIKSAIKEILSKRMFKRTRDGIVLIS